MVSRFTRLDSGIYFIGDLNHTQLCGCSAFGELEFWFSLIKITAIILFILAGIYLIGTGFTSPNGVKASMSHLFETESMFPYGVTGSWLASKLPSLHLWVLSLSVRLLLKPKTRILHFRKQLTLFLYAFYYSMWARWFVLLRSHLGQKFHQKKSICRNVYFSWIANCSRFNQLCCCDFSFIFGKQWNFCDQSYVIWFGFRQRCI